MKNFTSGLKVGDPIIISDGKRSRIASVRAITGAHILAAHSSGVMKFSRQTLRGIPGQLIMQGLRFVFSIREATPEELQHLHDERDIQSARFLASEPITGDQARAIIKILKGEQQ